MISHHLIHLFISVLFLPCCIGEFKKLGLNKTEFIMSGSVYSLDLAQHEPQSLQNVQMSLDKLEHWHELDRYCKYHIPTVLAQCTYFCGDEYFFYDIGDSPEKHLNKPIKGHCPLELSSEPCSFNASVPIDGIAKFQNMTCRKVFSPLFETINYLERFYLFGIHYMFDLRISLTNAEETKQQSYSFIESDMTIVLDKKSLLMKIKHAHKQEFKGWRYRLNGFGDLTEIPANRNYPDIEEFLQKGLLWIQDNNKIDRIYLMNWKHPYSYDFMPIYLQLNKATCTFEYRANLAHFTSSEAHYSFSELIPVNFSNKVEAANLTLSTSILKTKPKESVPLQITFALPNTDDILFSAHISENDDRSETLKLSFHQCPKRAMSLTVGARVMDGSKWYTLTVENVDEETMEFFHDLRYQYLKPTWICLNLMINASKPDYCALSSYIPSQATVDQQLTSGSTTLHTVTENTAATSKPSSDVTINNVFIFSAKLLCALGSHVIFCIFINKM